MGGAINSNKLAGHVAKLITWYFNMHNNTKLSIIIYVSVLKYICNQRFSQLAPFRIHFLHQSGHNVFLPITNPKS